MDYDKLLSDILKKEKKLLEQDSSKYLNYAIDGKYPDSGMKTWTSGFRPGLMWLMYRLSDDEEFKCYAEEYECRLDELFDEFVWLSHDVGFMTLLTAGQNYALTQNEKSRIRLLKAAHVLMGRYHPEGKYIRAWNHPGLEGQAIIDCMMNIQLLFLASELECDKRFYYTGLSYAETALKYLIREDGSVHHVMCFDEKTGKHTGYHKGAGYSEDSSWSRGAGWAIYGMAMTYGYTKDKRFLDVAIKVSKFFVENLNSDGVPPWDFRAPEKDITDTSAGAIAASGMLEVYRHTNEAIYRQYAENLLESMILHYGTINSDEEYLMSGATVEASKEKGVMTGISYADYYLTEAVMKLRFPKMKLVWE